MEEEFKEIPGFSNYKISKYGKVVNTLNGKFVKIFLNRYRCCNLKHKDKRYKKYIHVLLYLIFIGSIEKGFVIHHRDGDKLNNDLSNLEKMTREDHQKLHNLGKHHSEESKKNMRIAQQKNHNHAILTPDKVREIRLLLKEGLTQKEIAKIYNVRQQNISRIKLGKRWGYIK